MQTYSQTGFIGYQQDGTGEVRQIIGKAQENVAGQAQGIAEQAKQSIGGQAQQSIGGQAQQGVTEKAQQSIVELNQQDFVGQTSPTEIERPKYEIKMPASESQGGSQSKMPSSEMSSSEMKMLDAADCGCIMPEMKMEKKKDDDAVDYNLTYKKGFLLAPEDTKKSPFTMRINGRMQFRYAGFSPDADTFATQGGDLDIESQSGFEIERARLEFRGIFLDENLSYYFNLDADTDDNHEVIFHDFFVDYKFTDMFNIKVGKAKVPASYEWFGGSTTTRFADRSVATTFFRADRSSGIWFFGKQEEANLYWQTAITNGFFGADLDQGEIDDVFSYAGLFYWDPFGDYGKGYSDIKREDNLRLRVGATGAYSNQNPFDDGTNTNEVGFARLSDGTQIASTGALGPGLTVNNFDLYLTSIFAAGKYRGFSWNSEFYARWLQDLETIEGPVPTNNKLFDAGFYTDVGYTMIKDKFEVIGRVSNTDGLFGNSWEYAAGWNWFINGTHNHKLTFDATVLDGIPAQSSSPNFIAGQDGTLYRLQYQAAF